jgi:hypothetical protein
MMMTTSVTIMGQNYKRILSGGGVHEMGEEK